MTQMSPVLGVFRRKTLKGTFVVVIANRHSNARRLRGSAAFSCTAGGVAAACFLAAMAMVVVPAAFAQQTEPPAMAKQAAEPVQAPVATLADTATPLPDKPGRPLKSVPTSLPEL